MVDLVQNEITGWENRPKEACIATLLKVLWETEKRDAAKAVSE